MGSECNRFAHRCRRQEREQHTCVGFFFGARLSPLTSRIPGARATNAPSPGGNLVLECWYSRRLAPRRRSPKRRKTAQVPSDDRARANKKAAQVVTRGASGHTHLRDFLPLASSHPLLYCLLVGALSDCATTGISRGEWRRRSVWCVWECFAVPFLSLCVVLRFAPPVSMCRCVLCDAWPIGNSRFGCAGGGVFLLLAISSANPFFKNPKPSLSGLVFHRKAKASRHQPGC